MTDPSSTFATPRVAAGALFYDTEGRVLLVHPTYKDTWDIPGGYVERGESPAAACRRELAEELGLHRNPSRLIAVDWAPNERDGDKLLFLFDCGDLADDEQRIQLATDELDHWKWVPLDCLDDYLVPRLARRIRTVTLKRVTGAYLEHGHHSADSVLGINRKTNGRPSVQWLARNRLSRDERLAGRGTVVTDAVQGRWEPSGQVSVRVEPADERTATKLRIAPGEEVLVRERVMSADGHPVQLATSRLPRTLTAGTAIEDQNTGPGGLYARLDEAGHRLHHFVERVTSRLASAEEITRLRLTPGRPVLAITRTAYDTSGTPVETNDIVLVTERYELVYELPVG